MGIFDSFFGPKVHVKATAVALTESIPAIQAAKTPVDMQKHIQAFGDIDHPSIQHTLAVRCLILGMKEEAKKYYLLGANHGLKAGSEYYNSPHSDAIGQCIAHLLTQFEVSSKNDIVDKATVLAYVYLSKCINLCGEKAYDSRRTRGILLKDHEGPYAVDRFMYMAFPEQAIEILLIADLVKSALGYATINPSVAERNMESANTYQYIIGEMPIAGKKAEEWPLNALAEIGEKRHQFAFKQLDVRYLSGSYDLSEADFKAIFV